MKLYEVGDLLAQAQELHEAGDLDQAERMYNAILNRQMGNPSLFYLLGSLHMQKGNNGLASLLLEECLKAPEMSEFSEAWNNLGIAYKKEFMKGPAAACFEKAWKCAPKCADYPSNWAGCYINEGMPSRAIELSDEALKIDPGHVQSRWHKGLALLEQQKWKEGFEYYEARRDGVFQGRGSDIPKERNYAETGMTPWWDGKSKGLVVVHGEQGIGDEILFATAFPDAMKSGAELVFECTPRLESLLKRSLECRVVGTHEVDGKSWLEGRKVDYKIGVGSFGRLFRSDGNFPGTPYLVPNPKQVRHYQNKLDNLSSRPKIGLAWQGGVPTTRVDLRTIRLESMTPLFEHDVDFISLQYTKAAKEEVQAYKAKTGNRIVHWKTAAEAENMDEYASLLSCMDMVISVCQTAIHISGGLGVPCLCLTPYAPAWRYGVTGDMPWYDSVELIRQKKGETWDAAIKEASERLGEFLNEREAA